VAFPGSIIPSGTASKARAIFPANLLFSESAAVTYDETTGLFSVKESGIYEISYWAVVTLPQERPFSLTLDLETPQNVSIVGSERVVTVSADTPDTLIIPAISAALVTRLLAGMSFGLNILHDGTKFPNLTDISVLIKKLS
jgi:hypothetical protein